jgi:broad specificity phosphatase PhoE
LGFGRFSNIRAMSIALAEIYLARHGETEWSVSGRHTGRTDIPLTDAGQRNARRLGQRLQGLVFDGVWTSPLKRARQTCELAGFGDRARIDADLMEMDYGQYNGLVMEEIRRQRPGWDPFLDGCPGGESVSQITARADRVVGRLRALPQGRVLLFSHMHFLQFLAVRWIDLAGEHGRRFYLSTAALSVLGYNHTADEPVIRLWNDDRHVGTYE